MWEQGGSNSSAAQWRDLILVQKLSWLEILDLPGADHDDARKMKRERLYSDENESEFD